MNCETDGCNNLATKWLGSGFDRVKLCNVCDAARRRANIPPPPVPPEEIAERRRLEEDARIQLERSLRQSMAEAMRNEVLERKAPRPRVGGIRSAAAIVHPVPPPPPVEAVAERPKRQRPVADRLVELLRANNGATNGTAREILGLSRGSLREVCKRLRREGKLDKNDRRNPLHFDRIFLAGTAPGYAEVDARCLVSGCQRQRVARGMCKPCYARWTKGVIQAPNVEPPRPVWADLLIAIADAGSVKTTSLMHMKQAKNYIATVRNRGLVMVPKHGWNEITEEGRMLVDSWRNP